MSEVIDFKTGKRTSTKDKIEDNIEDKIEDIEDLSFEEAIAKNAANQKRLAEARAKANESVKRSHRLKNGKKK